MSLGVNQTRYGQTKIVSFTADYWSQCYMVTKENLSLLADLLEPWRVKFISIWLQYEICVYWQAGWNI